MNFGNFTKGAKIKITFFTCYSASYVSQNS